MIVGSGTTTELAKISLYVATLNETLISDHCFCALFWLLCDGLIQLLGSLRIWFAEIS